MFNKKLVMSLLALVVFALPLVGCSNSGSGSDDQFDLAIVSISPSEANNARFIKGVEEAVADLGWKVSVTDAHGSADEANAAIQNFVTRKVDAIIDMVFPVTSLASGLRVASEAKIPVGTWGGGMGTAVVVTNGSGGLHSIPIVEQMIKDMEGKGDVLALTYRTGQVAREREDVLDKAFADYPEIKVTKNEVKIPGYLQDGAQYANAWLASHPSGSSKLAIWGSWDDPALGAISSLKQQDRKDVLVYGQNGNADAIKAVREGWMTATAWQDSYSEGIKMVEVLVEAIEKGDEWEPIAAEIPAVLITKDNVEQFIKDHPEAIENVQ
ncbi:MAG: sugar ABC transporter substrate-binding protein [Paenibacillaceae bacterium]